MPLDSQCLSQLYPSNMDLEVLGLLIVGAGLHGLIMAKTHLEAHHDASLLVVDESSTVGGTWAAERLYPGLKTNNVWGSYELSDFPMRPERYGAGSKGMDTGKEQGHIPGEVVHEYLCDVAEEFGIDRFLKLGTRVVRAELDEKGVWSVELQPTNNDKADSSQPGSQTVRAHRLVLATGLTSKPHIPSLPGSETFNRPIVYSKQLRSRAEQLSKAKCVVVVGGNKSAWDVAYTAARTGSQVDMVIRPSGGGPSYVWPRRFSLNLFGVEFGTSLAKLSTSRFFTMFDPSPVGNVPWPFSWLKRALHRTTPGQLITRSFWNHLDTTIRKANNYASHPELRKLEPWTTPFWMGNSLSIHNYETDWFNLVRKGKIRVHIADVGRLSEGVVHLRNEEGEGEREDIETDALILCTGWRVGFPVRFDREEEGKDEVEGEVTKMVYENIPYLLSLPRRTPNAPTCQAAGTEKKPSNLPLLYHDILPLQPPFIQNRNIAFIGMSISVHAVVVAQAQALWITALFDDKIPHLHSDSIINVEEIRKKALFDRAYGAARRPKETGGMAGQHTDLVFDSLAYVDGLLRELGINPYRKGSFWREMTQPYRVSDYRRLVGEWIALQSDLSAAGT
ncbi:hypothetical protein BDV06DRAFT_234738 [Aspergillus oleicola]